MSAARELEIVECVSPVSEPRKRSFSGRASLRKLLDEIGWDVPLESTKILLDGQEVPFHMWGILCPKHGSQVVFVRRSHVEGFAAVVAFFVAAGKAAVSAATLGAIGGTAASGVGVVSGSIALAGSLGTAVGTLLGTTALSLGVSQLASSLIGSPNQDVDPLDGGPESPTLQGTGNSVRPNAPFPYVAGSFRFDPPFGAFPFTVVRGGESVFMAVFIVGRGRMDITNAMIGDVPIEQFTRARVFYRGGNLIPSNPLQIYTNKVFQTGLNSVFDPIPFGSANYFSPWVQFRVEGQGHGRLGVDFNFPAGLAVIRDNGPRDYFFAVEIQYRQIIAGVPGSWLNAADVGDFGPLGLEGRTSIVNNSFIGNAIQYIGQSSRPFQSGLTWTVSGGADDEWDVRIRRVERSDPRVLPGGPETRQTFGTFIWFAVKGFNFRNSPLDVQGVATVEVEIPLDTQFNGISNNFSVLVTRLYRIYDPTNFLGSGIDADGWTLGYFPSSNPAAIIRDILQGENNRRPVPNSKINIDVITAFYIYCGFYLDGPASGLRFDFIFDARMSIFEACNLVANAGRGKFGLDSQGRFTVIFDSAKTTPVAKISAANCRLFKMDLLFPREVQAVRVQYIDRDGGFDQDAELEVFADGYSADGAGGTIVADENFFENLSLPGTTTVQQAYILGRYFLTEKKLRRRIFQIEQGLEHLQYNVGSLVTFSHPGALNELASGRVKSSSAAVYRDLFDRLIPEQAIDPRTVTAATVTYGDLSGPVSRGDGAAQLVATSSSAAILLSIFGSGFTNFLNCRFDLDAMVGNLTNLSATDGIRVRFYSGSGSTNWREWRLGTNDSLNATTLTTVGNTLASAGDANNGTYLPAQTTQVEIYANVVNGAAGRTYRFCNFRISRTDDKIVEVELDQFVPMIQPTLYELEYRRDVGPSIVNDIQRLFLKTPTLGVGQGRLTRFVYFRDFQITPGTTEPLEGQLYSYGVGLESVARCIVREKAAGQDLTAQVTLVDEAPGVHSVAGFVPSFPPPTTLPVPIRRVAPAQPTILQTVSDERAILRLSDGTLQPRILIHVQAPFVFGRPSAEYLIVFYRRILPSTLQGVSLGQIPITSEIIIPDVEEGATYRVSIQSATKDGRVSEAASIDILVEGKTGLPPDVQQFRLEGTLLRWTLPFAPPDLAGFKIKKGAIGGTFELARWITQPMLVASPPFDVSTIPDPGNATLYIVAVDTIGNESEIPATLTGFIGVPPVQNAVRTIDIDAAGFGIIDQELSILSGFESLIAQELPSSTLEIAQLPGEDPDLITMIQADTVNSNTLFVERTLIDEMMQSLLVTSPTSASGPTFTMTYGAAQNVTDRMLLGRFRGGKASVTWTVRYKIIQSDDATKWSRWDVAGLGTLSYVDADVDLTDAPDATNNGGADLSNIGAIEVSVVCSSPADDDFVHFDNLRWLGGTVNGVEVVSGDLKTMVVGDSFWNSDPNSSFWNSSGAADFWEAVVYFDGIYEFEVEIFSSDLPGSLRLSMSDPGVDFQIFYKIPGGTEFMPFPGILELPDDGFYRFKILLAGGFVQGVIDQLAVIVDAPDLTEKISNFSVSNTGTVRLPITQTFRQITDIMYTVRGTTPGIALFLDYATTIGAGPSVQIVNSTTGARITASADFEVRGVQG